MKRNGFNHPRSNPYQSEFRQELIPVPDDAEWVCLVPVIGTTRLSRGEVLKRSSRVSGPKRKGREGLRRLIKEREMSALG